MAEYDLLNPDRYPKEYFQQTLEDHLVETVRLLLELTPASRADWASKLSEIMQDEDTANDFVETSWQ